MKESIYLIGWADAFWVVQTYDKGQLWISSSDLKVNSTLNASKYVHVNYINSLMLWSMDPASIRILELTGSKSKWLWPCHPHYFKIWQAERIESWMPKFIDAQLFMLYFVTRTRKQWSLHFLCHAIMFIGLKTLFELLLLTYCLERNPILCVFHKSAVLGLF